MKKKTEGFVVVRAVGRGRTWDVINALTGEVVEGGFFNLDNALAAAVEHNANLS